MAEDEERAAPRADAPGSASAHRLRTSPRVLGAAIAVLAVLVIVGIAVVFGSSGSAAGRTTPPPWPVPSDTVERAEAAGLPMLGKEALAMHLHEHLTITVDGSPVTVPARIGIRVVGGRETDLSAIHTHDTTGVVHVESPVKRQFTLGQVFTEWSVLLEPGRVGSYRDGQDGTRVALFVDRRRSTGDPRAVVLTARQDIDFVITTDGSVPAAPPSGFAFPAGY